MDGSPMVIMVLLSIMVLVWLLVEGSTILVSASAVLPGGSQRLTRLGAFFLGTEAWTLALLGSGHALVPGATHEVLGRVGGALALFVAGWMLRDLGLWLGPRFRSSAAGALARAAVSVGAVAQVVGIVAVTVGWLLVRPGLTPGAGAGMLLALVPPVLVLGAVLLVLLRRLPAASHFAWEGASPGR